MATVKGSNWTEERHEVLKDITWEEIDAIAERLEVEHPEEYSTPEEIMAMAERVEEPEAATRRAEMAGA
jgi:DNA-binding ferritin-like protein